MKIDPVVLLCGLFCIYPLLFFGIPAFVAGRLWGRTRFRSPLEIKPEGTPVPLARPAARPQVPNRPGTPEKFG